MINKSLLKMFLLDDDSIFAARGVLGDVVGVKGIQASSGLNPRQAVDYLTPMPSSKLYSIEGSEIKLKTRLNNSADIEMGDTPVTQELFEAVMGFNTSEYKGFADSPQRPVENLIWNDCISFCNQLSLYFQLNPYYSIEVLKSARDNSKSIKFAEVKILGGTGFRLPTTQEWELFAKAGTQNIYSGTSDTDEIWRYGWYKDNSTDETHRVAQLLPNEWGMYDMAGNVSEWCWDEVKIPNDSSNFRMAKGGNFFSEADIMKIDNKLQIYRPNESSEDRGFRVCRSCLKH